MLDEQRRGIINQATYEFGMQENEAANAIYICINMKKRSVCKYRVGFLPTKIHVAAKYVFLLNFVGVNAQVTSHTAVRHDSDTHKGNAQNAKVETRRHQHSNNHSSKSWRSDGPSSCLDGSSHGWVPVNTHSAPVPVRGCLWLTHSPQHTIHNRVSKLDRAEKTKSVNMEAEHQQGPE